MSRETTTKSLVYGALCVALSFALSFVKVFSMPMGGSITLCSMLPVIYYGYRFGVGKGLLAGLALGLLEFVQEPILLATWLRAALQFLLDYPLAFMSLGLGGLLRSKKSLTDGAAWRLPLACLLAGFLRFLCHAVSGAVFFGEYAPEGMNVWLYTIGYNGGYMGVETLVCMAVCAIPPVQKLLLKEN